MRCPYCDVDNVAEARFCKACGASLEEASSDMTSQLIKYEQRLEPASNNPGDSFAFLQSPADYAEEKDAASQLSSVQGMSRKQIREIRLAEAARVGISMSFYKILTKALLFLQAGLIAMTGIGMIDGTQYYQIGATPSEVYRQVPVLGTLDKVCGLLYLAASITALVARHLLAGMDKRGLPTLYMYYAVRILAALIYCVGVLSILKVTTDFSIYENIAVAVVWLIGCYRYFSNRKQFFTER